MKKAQGFRTLRMVYKLLASLHLRNGYKINKEIAHGVARILKNKFPSGKGSQRNLLLTGCVNTFQNQRKKINVDLSNYNNVLCAFACLGVVLRRAVPFWPKQEAACL